MSGESFCLSNKVVHLFDEKFLKSQFAETTNNYNSASIRSVNHGENKRYLVEEKSGEGEEGESKKA